VPIAGAPQARLGAIRLGVQLGIVCAGVAALMTTASDHPYMSLSMRLSGERAPATSPVSENTAFEATEANPRSGDRHCFSSSLTIGVGFAALAMFYSLYLYHVLYHRRLTGHDVWYTPSDIWNTVNAGRFVWHGALGYVYDTGLSYALPLSFILTAPISALVDHFHLAEGFFPLARPSAWLIVGPFSLLFGIFLLDAVRRLAWDLGIRRKLWMVQLLAVVVVLVPSFQWGHFEDIIALIFVLHAARYILSTDFVRAALLVSLAVTSKQWAVMLIPFLVFLAPRGRRLRCLAAACALPGLFTLFVLGFGGRVAFDALFSPVNMGRTAPGHLAFYATWLGSKTSQSSRSIGMLLSVFVGWKFRKVRGVPQVLAVMSLLLLIRPFSEAINYSYYWSPALILAGFVGVAAHGRFRIRDWMWQVPAIAWTLPHGNPAESAWWWAVELVLLACVYFQVARNCGFRFRPAASEAVPQETEGAAASHRNGVGSPAQEAASLH